MTEDDKRMLLKLGKGVELKVNKDWSGMATLSWRASYVRVEASIPASILSYLLENDLNTLLANGSGKDQGDES